MAAVGLALRAEEAEFLSRQRDSPHLKQGYNIHDFYSLCRGEQQEQSCSPAAGQCRLVVREAAHLLAPLHWEEICSQPTVHLYHDFLTHKEVAHLTLPHCCTPAVLCRST